MRTNIVLACAALLGLFIAAHGSIGQGGTGGASDFSELTGTATDAQIPNTITIDLAAKATALAANGANCSAGQYPLGVDASGAAESCTADSGGGAMTTSTVAGLPGTCAVGDHRYVTDATTTVGLWKNYYCTATNTWTQAGYVAGPTGAVTVTEVAANSYEIDVDPAAIVIPTEYRKRTCDIVVGDTSGSVITDAQLGPQKGMCFIPWAATLVEINVFADAGTPNVILQSRNTAGTTADLTSAALATAASGARACSNTGGTTCIDGTTTGSATLQNTALTQGMYIELKSGTAGGVAKLMTVHAIYTVD